jgi:hypothetical protein
MCSASACEYYWSIERWIHSNRRNNLHQTLVRDSFAHTQTLC